MISPERFADLTARYRALRLAVVGDFCLDRYLEIDPARAETSIETGLPVHNVVRVRAQPGAAGTIVANLVALGVGTIHAVGFCGEDGEGWELARALRALPGVDLTHFVQTSARATFTYTKPLLTHPTGPPRELSRLDVKNWTPTPEALAQSLADSLRALAPEVDGVIIMDQVSLAGTGVVCAPVLAVLEELAVSRPTLPILADSRRTLRGFPPLLLKMNALELAELTGTPLDAAPAVIAARAAALARSNGRGVVVTLAERGMLVAKPDGATCTLPAHPLRGPIDVVGAGDAVTANLVAALAAGAGLPEALAMANAAASIVVHQLGATGSAHPEEIGELLFPRQLGPASG